MRERYFDNAATTPIDPRVLREMLPFLESEFGNPHSIHSFGMRAMAAIDQARERIATLINAEDPSQIVFTSGATEANNWILRQFQENPGGWISPFEHSSVREPGEQYGYRALSNQGLSLTRPDHLSGLVSVMSVNNELGVRWDVRDFTGGAVSLHSDLTQQVGKLATDVEGLDYASFSAHKFYGPKGVGALCIQAQSPEPFFFGGEQEEGLRSGTLNVPGIIGMGAAAAIALDQQESDEAHVRDLRSIVLENLRLPDIRVNEGTAQSPYILSISFQGLEGETLLVEADQAGYAISAGAACSSKATEPSHVLTTLGLEKEWLRGTVRISFGRFNTQESALGLAKALCFAVERIRDF